MRCPEGYVIIDQIHNAVQRFGSALGGCTMTGYRVEQMAQKYMERDIISLHTDLPGFPDGRIRLLYAVLGHQADASRDKELLSLAASLVQLGLDTHDRVENGAGTGSMAAMRSRQLKVLAGDYFSSRFYQLLSQAGRIDAVRRLSEAICELNRIKMIWYTGIRQTKLSAEEYLHYGAEIKSGLFASFSGMMNGIYERLWPEMVERFCRCELLLEELAAAHKADHPGGGWGFWHILQVGTEEDRQALSERRDDAGLLRQLTDKYGVADKLGSLLRQSIQQLQSLAARIPSDKLMRDIQPLIERFIAAVGPQHAAVLKELG
jgi:heptaprenyl diphosphate synthase